MTHLRKWALALCLALLSINCSVSKADIITVPIADTGLSVTVQSGSNAQSLQNIYNNPNAVSVGAQLGDDNNAHVPLGFNFPYWGKNFTESWMHSNGVVSFQNPSNTGNFCCAGQDLRSTTNPQYNYAIFPLWTDLIIRSGASAYYLGTPNSMTYGWYGTSEYSNSNAKSTFEVKIDNSGALDIRWSGAVISAQTNTIGFTGDLSKGEYFQAHHANNLNINTATQLTTLGTGVDPCVSNPLSSTTCAGYAQAYLNQQCQLNALYDKSCPGYAMAYHNQQCSQNALSFSDCPGYAQALRTQQCTQNPLSHNDCPGYGAAYALQQQRQQAAVAQTPSASTTPTPSPAPAAGSQANQTPATAATSVSAPAAEQPTAAATTPAAVSTSSTTASAPVTSSAPTANNPQPKPGEVQQTSKPTASVNQIMSIVNSEQSRVNQVERSTVQTAVSEASAASDRAQDAAVSIALDTAKTSSAQSQTQTTNNMAAIPNTSNTVGSVFGTVSTGTANSTAVAVIKPTTVIFETNISTTSTQSQTLLTPNQTQDTNKQTDNKDTSLATVEQPKASIATQIQQAVEERAITNSAAAEPRAESVNRNAANNQLAAGVDIASMAVTPAGYAQYSATLPDAAFYAPKEIYRNQKVIDNQRLVRGLTRGSDRLHEQMMEQQYPITR